jgi:hypothetical protein
MLQSKAVGWAFHFFLSSICTPSVADHVPAAAAAALAVIAAPLGASARVVESGCHGFQSAVCFPNAAVLALKFVRALHHKFHRDMDRSLKPIQGPCRLQHCPSAI